VANVRIGDRYHERYQVLARIGEGAFAYVYHARDPSGRDLALKVLKDPFIGDREVVERFQREVFAVASIDSPHVVGLSDFGLSGDDFFMVMELVHGPSLREILHARPWTATDVYVIVGQIAHALHTAHRKGIVHRDLKPENVMLVELPGGTWQVKVLDFGLAKLPELERSLGLDSLTRRGQLFGTPQYLSPEQIRGKPLDGGADLFALGVIAYEMIAGRRPWDGPEEAAREVLMMVLHNPPPPIEKTTQLSPSLVERLESVNAFLLRALAKDRAERPADAEAFFRELGTALFGDQVPELPSTGAKVEKPLDKVSSQSIELVIGRVPRQRAAGDEGSDATIPFVTERKNDTIQQPAFPDSGSLRVEPKVEIDKSSGIPIYVTDGQSGKSGKKLHSGWYQPPSDGAAPIRSEPRAAPDSQKATLPRPAAVETPREGSRAWGRLFLFLLMAAIAVGAFWLGRNWK
jgi:serine/threonine protein kinase